MGLDPKKVRALQLNLEGLFKLLGGSPDDRQRFWEFHKGVTTPAVARLMNAQLDAMAANVKTLQGSTKALKDAGQQIVKGG